MADEQDLPYAPMPITQPFAGLPVQRLVPRHYTLEAEHGVLGVAPQPLVPNAPTASVDEPESVVHVPVAHTQPVDEGEAV